MGNVILDNVLGRNLVSDSLFDRLVARIVRENQVKLVLGERIMDQALAFLAACAQAEGPLAPSPLVDIGWHTFILYTREYEEFCAEVAGGFIHHEPDDIVGTEPASGSMILSAVAEIRRAGYYVDDVLWASNAKCHQCTNGCTHSGGDTGCHQRVAPQESQDIALAV